jgi:xylulose-5-phosphate/fructose-6-phosphate phosphoketolase
VPSLGSKEAHLKQKMLDSKLRSRQYTRDHGEDPPEIRDWFWPY